MVIGRCVWGKTDADFDTLEIYRVFDAPGFGPMTLKEPVCVLKEVIDQKTICSIYARGSATFDEIRIGTTLHSVMMGTKPLAVKK